VVLPLVVHLLRKYKALYFVFTGLATNIAVIASIMQFTGNSECSKLDGGTRMCYLSFLILSTLIALKIIENRILKNLKTIIYNMSAQVSLLNISL